ncbi:hypothetical protein GN958_ATG03355 [Phytophthora infestans]|uniref:Uncharacterized protein n=1 Tax=Phytophthora infestans TaxID=4787 RepID=A0A8S9V7U5_PHYIN|nr:hypothetical protein GN958_ATG03354 [Phytophthora infestans]KAF4147483.1 hypothetical protein GN958_ATG03355 [Phytophthora infestans]
MKKARVPVISYEFICFVTGVQLRQGVNNNNFAYQFKPQSRQVRYHSFFALRKATDYGVGDKPAAMQLIMHVPSAALQERTAGKVPTPAVTVPKTTPAAA